jgi:type III secretion protein U
MGEKTEQASPKKLRDARKKGQVAKSQDLPAAFTFIVSLAVTLNLMGWLFSNVSAFTITAFKQISAGELEGTIVALYSEAFMLIFTLSLPIMIAVNIVGVIVNFLSVGPTFALEVFKPDIKKFDPIQNLKAKFKLKTLVELLKQVFKLSVAGYIIYTVLLKALPVMVNTVKLPLFTSLMLFNSFLLEVVYKVGIFFIAVAVADFIYQKHTFANEMKMEKFEVKQEYKNSEGDPQIKGKRKQIAQENAYQDGPAAEIKLAKAVVTNPTHLAVAIAYDTDEDAAPYVVAKGRGSEAVDIVKMAEELKIPILRNIPLAHQLWEKSEVFEYIPEDTYDAIAEILRWISSMEAKAKLEMEIG